MRHEHKYFIWQVKSVFETVQDDDMPAHDLGPLYRMVEYAFMGCNCGDVIKTKVRNNPKDAAA